MAFQAFFDDSGAKGDGVWMSMSGLFAPAAVMATVADEWTKYLRAEYPGKLAYFKMSEANTLSGQFNFWSPEKRDLKVRQMAGVINRTDLLGVGAALHMPSIEALSLEAIHGADFDALDQPFIQLAQYVLVSAITEAVAAGAAKPMDVFYDNQGRFQPVMVKEWNEWRDEEPDPARLAVYPIWPMFRDDREVVMLQAADLLAGERRYRAGEKTDWPSWLADEPLCPKLPLSKWCKTIAHDDVNALREHLRERGLLRPIEPDLSCD